MSRAGTCRVVSAVQDREKPKACSDQVLAPGVVVHLDLQKKTLSPQFEAPVRASRTTLGGSSWPTARKWRTPRHRFA